MVADIVCPRCSKRIGSSVVRIHAYECFHRIVINDVELAISYRTPTAIHLKGRTIVYRGVPSKVESAWLVIHAMEGIVPLTDKQIETIILLK